MGQTLRRAAHTVGEETLHPLIPESKMMLLDEREDTRGKSIKALSTLSHGPTLS